VKRLFRGLRREAPEAAYDTVIIGAGVGGLVTANLLAREGLKVLLVEQHYMVGGYCSTFRRKGYTFDAATHFYPLLGNPHTLTGKLLGELGVKTGWVKMDPVDTFHFPDGSKFEVPGDFDTYLARVKQAFPAEQAHLDRFFSEVREAYLLGLLAYFRGHDKPRLERYRDLSVRQVLDRHFTDPKLKLLLTADCPHWGSPPARTSFVFDSMLRLSYFLGNYYPVLGSQAFADELARCFEARGGHILMSTRAERILVRDGRAQGVDLRTLRGPLQGQRRVLARTVISNADMLHTLEQLLPAKTLDPAYLQQVRSLRPSFPCFLTHIGLRDIEPEVLEAVQGYYWNSWDPDQVGDGGLRCKVFVPTVYEPRMAPAGGQVVILQKVQQIDYRQIDDWPAHKRGVEDYVVSHLENLVPGISRKIVVKVSASALTSWRFTGNKFGAMLGWEMSPDQLGSRRPGIESPIKNLYLVGHWTRPGGGITPVIVSAQQVAAEVAGATSSVPWPLDGVAGQAAAAAGW